MSVRLSSYISVYTIAVCLYQESLVKREINFIVYYLLHATSDALTLDLPSSLLERLSFNSYQ